MSIRYSNYDLNELPRIPDSALNDNCRIIISLPNGPDRLVGTITLGQVKNYGGGSTTTTTTTPAPALPPVLSYAGGGGALTWTDSTSAANWEVTYFVDGGWAVAGTTAGGTKTFTPTFNAIYKVTGLDSGGHAVTPDSNEVGISDINSNGS